jgi:DNA-binding transcriptional ArsR family regulator
VSICLEKYITICLYRLVTVFEAVSEPSRRAILDLLIERRLAVGELVDETGLSQPNTSRHLRILREAGLVQARIEGARRLYELCPEGLSEIERWLTPYRRLWRSSLDALEDHLEAME